MNITEGFILSSVKYGETSLIFNVFTKEFGTKSFIKKGFFSLKKQKNHQFFPLQKVEISFQKNDKELQLIHSIQSFHFPLSNAIYKANILLFLSEILAICLQKEPKNIALYQFIERSIHQLETANSYALFPIQFLLDFSGFLGFFPSESSYIEGSYFSLSQGIFITTKSTETIPENLSFALYQILNNQETYLQKTERIALLETILSYYNHHIPNFRFPKSLEIIKEIFQ